MRIREIKRQAKQNYKRQYSDMMLIGFGSTVILSAISLLTVTMGYYLFYGAICTGIYYAFYRNSQGIKISPQDALYGFRERFGPAFVAGFVVSLIVNIPKFLQVINILASLLKLLSLLNISGFGDNPIFEQLSNGISATLVAINFFAFIVMLSLQMSTYLLARNPEMGASDALLTSRKMMYGFKFRYLLLKFSFIGWDILNVVTIGFAKVYTQGYYYAAETIFFNDVYDRYMQRMEAQQAQNGETQAATTAQEASLRVQGVIKEDK